MVQTYQNLIHHNCSECNKINHNAENIIFKSSKWSTEMPQEGLDVERQALKIIPSHRLNQKQQKKKNEGKEKKNLRKSKRPLTRQRKVPP